MGQYFKVFNLDKKQLLHPHEFNDGMKFLEIAQSSCGTLTGLAYLLRRSSSYGGGDTESKNSLVGSWAGDRITIVGDYDDSGIYANSEAFTDISKSVAIIVREEMDKYSCGSCGSPLRAR